MEKRREVRLLVGEKHPLIICLQETKFMVCDDSVCSSLWGSSSYAFSYWPSVGASGGLLTMWDSSEVEVWSSVSQEHVLIIHGRMISSNEEFYLFNVYAPCDARGKQDLWVSLSQRLSHLRGQKVCVCVNFNVVRMRKERRSVRNDGVSPNVVLFNHFIDDIYLVDLPLCGRRFTWFKGDGISMSRIDRFLLSEKWCLRWPNCLQIALRRGVSDHCPLQLLVDEANWGPRPFRMLKCWQDMAGYHQFVSEKWRSYNVEGWGSFVLKEKLKLIKKKKKWF